MCVCHVKEAGAKPHTHRDAPLPPAFPHQTGCTPLSVAAFNGHGLIAAFLLAKGADVRLKNDAGLTAAAVAGARGHRDIVTLCMASVKADGRGDGGESDVCVIA